MVMGNRKQGIFPWTFFLVLAIFFGTVSLYIHLDGMRLGGDRALVKIIEQRLVSGKALVEASMSALEEEFLIGGRESFLSEAIKIDKKYPKQMGFFLYKQGRLVGWSNNNLPMPMRIDDLGAKPLQRIGVVWSLVYRRHVQDYVIVGLQYIGTKYPWQNEILRNELSPYFGLSNRVFLSESEGVKIQTPLEGVSFYVQKNNINNVKVTPASFLLFVLSFLLLAVLCSFLFQFIQINVPFLKATLLFLVMLLWYFVHYLLGLPYGVFKTELFSPSLYVNPFVFDALGHLFFLVYIGSTAVLYFFYLLKNVKTAPNSLPLAYINMSAIYMLFLLMMYVSVGLVKDSQINFNLFRLANMDLYSYIGVAIILLMQFTWVVLLYNVFRQVKQTPKFSTVHLLVLMGLFTVVYYVILGSLFAAVMCIVFVAVCIVIWFVFEHFNYRYKLAGEVFVYLILYSLLTTWVLIYYYDLREESFRRTQAVTWEPKNDAFLEERFITSYETMQAHLQMQYENSVQQQTTSQVKAFRNIIEPYFENFLPDYDMQLQWLKVVDTTKQNIDSVTLACLLEKQLYFRNAQNIIVPDTLCLLQGDFKYRKYMGRIPIIGTKGDIDAWIYVDFISKPPVKEFGLPAILQNNSYAKLKALNQYSYAFYKKGYLVEQAGQYSYSKRFASDDLVDDFYLRDGYSHFNYKASDEDILVLSLPEPTFLQYLAVLAFMIMSYVILGIGLYSFLFNRLLFAGYSTFQGRLQYNILALLVFSFVVIGFLSMYNIYRLNDSKNKSMIEEKARILFSVLQDANKDIDFQNLYQVFRTDVILYAEDGSLLASSRPEIFKRGLLAPFINPTALYQMQWENSQVNIQEESIGYQTYYSCYMPLRFEGRDEIAYLNMPYFAKQNEIEDKISFFAQSFLNIYLFLLILAIAMGVLVSRRLSHPIDMIKTKIKKINLHVENEKIEWHRNDELGSLVHEYNRMVDELTISAEKLAESERHAAWREMAKQVAHEIKNPLTPMKLNIQYLQRAWDNGAEDFDEKMAKVTRALEEQIDVLTHIASQFSTFAAISEVEREQIELRDLVENVVQVFKSADNIEFTFKYPANPIYIMGDKSQMVRVFNNIYKNSIQAIEKNKKAGFVETLVYTLQDNVVVEIKDNGCGIKPEQFEYIFRPHFTTKTKGTGLGLSLVKKMIETHGGSINIVSHPALYTKVTITFPLYNATDA